jgi:hypothetical protein
MCLERAASDFTRAVARLRGMPRPTGCAAAQRLYLGATRDEQIARFERLAYGLDSASRQARRFVRFSRAGDRAESHS